MQRVDLQNQSHLQPGAQGNIQRRPLAQEPFARRNARHAGSIRQGHDHRARQLPDRGNGMHAAVRVQQLEPDLVRGAALSPHNQFHVLAARILQPEPHRGALARRKPLVQQLDRKQVGNHHRRSRRNQADLFVLRRPDHQRVGQDGLGGQVVIPRQRHARHNARPCRKFEGIGELLPALCFHVQGHVVEASRGGIRDHVFEAVDDAFPHRAVIGPRYGNDRELNGAARAFVQGAANKVVGLEHIEALGAIVSRVFVDIGGQRRHDIGHQQRLRPAFQIQTESVNLSRLGVLPGNARQRVDSLFHLQRMHGEQGDVCEDGSGWNGLIADRVERRRRVVPSARQRVAVHDRGYGIARRPRGQPRHRVDRRTFPVDVVADRIRDSVPLEHGQARIPRKTRIRRRRRGHGVRQHRNDGAQRTGRCLRIRFPISCHGIEIRSIRGHIAPRCRPATGGERGEFPRAGCLAIENVVGRDRQRRPRQVHVPARARHRRQPVRRLQPRQVALIDQRPHRASQRGGHVAHFVHGRNAELQELVGQAGARRQRHRPRPYRQTGRRQCDGVPVRLHLRQSPREFRDLRRQVARRAHQLDRHRHRTPEYVADRIARDRR